MDLIDLQRKLMAAARANPPSDGVPYAFEKRISALLAGKAAFDPWTGWARGLSRAAALCVLVVLFVAAWSVFLPTSNQETLSQDVETTLFAAVDNAPTDAAAEQQ
jgi:peptidoglycan/LPS O-acetylase OafA/YrhL